MPNSFESKNSVVFKVLRSVQKFNASKSPADVPELLQSTKGLTEGYLDLQGAPSPAETNLCINLLSQELITTHRDKQRLGEENRRLSKSLHSVIDLTEQLRK